MKPNKRKRRTTVETQTVKLVFDTAAALQREGVRSGHEESRHLLFRGPSHFVDVCIERPTKDSPPMILGQLSNADGQAPPVGTTPIRVESDTGRPMTTRSNERGEFKLKRQLQPNTRLLFHLGGRKLLEIPLGELLGVDQ